MRILFLLLLFLPSLLSAQVKILMPVVVKDAFGKAVTDLKESDFQVSGPRNTRVSEVSIVSPDDDSKRTIVMLYDAVNIPTNSFESNVRDLREFLAQVANRRLPVTVLVNTQTGLHLVYSARTSPEVLSAALTATADAKAKATPIADPKVEEQAKNLSLLHTAVNVPRSRLDTGIDQMKSLLAFSHLNERLPGRKALVWVTLASPVSATDQSAYWSSTTTHADRSLVPMYEATVEQLNAAHVSVYPLFFTQANPENSQALWDLWTGLKQLAESTGGLPYRLGQQTSFLAAIESAMGDLSSYYMVAIEVPTPNDTDWVPVKIRVTRPGLAVRAAPGFVGLKPLKSN